MATTNELNGSMSNAIAGLGTSEFVVVTAGSYRFSIRSTMVAPSGLSILIKKNGSTIGTSPTPTAVDSSAGLVVSAQCAAADSITFVLASTNLNDAPPNNIKSVISADLIDGSV